MIHLTQEQLQEALIRLRSYAGWMYYDPRAIKQLEEGEGEHKGRRFSISVGMDGKPVMTLKDTGVQGIYNCKITTAPRSGVNQLNGVDYSFTLENKSALSSEDAIHLEEMGIFVLSFFQRMNAFLFFSRMEDVTIAQISGSLTKATEPIS